MPLPAVTTARRAELVADLHQQPRRALKATGVEFIDDNGGGPGVR